MITPSQSGFRKLHSTTTSLVHVIDKWLKNMELGKLTGVTFIDLRKAFDTVDLDIVLQKLKMYGVATGTVEYHWFHSYLTNRSQKVTIEGVLSEPLETKVGVPQGSILGPLLFVLYLNDLPGTVSNSEVNMYADDTEVDYSSPSVTDIEENINDDLQSLTTFFANNKLSLNTKKCEVILCGTRQRVKDQNLTIRVGDEDLPCVADATYLGAVIDKNLTWANHIDKVISKVSSRIGVLRKMKNIVPHDTLKHLYNALVLPHFDYADLIYGMGYKTDLDRLQKVQTRAARLLTGSGPRTPREGMFASLHWLSLTNRRSYNKAVLVYKCLNGLAPDYLCDMFRYETYVYQTRSSNLGLLHEPKAKSVFFENSFQVSGACLWNDIPKDIRDSSTLTSFKHALYKHYLGKTQFKS